MSKTQRSIPKRAKSPTLTLALVNREIYKMRRIAEEWRLRTLCVNTSALDALDKFNYDLSVSCCTTLLDLCAKYYTLPNVFEVRRQAALDLLLKGEALCGDFFNDAYNKPLSGSGRAN